MKFVADLHLHSRYSRAVSQAMTLSNMAQWASYKGINVLATGDFTHPFWFDQLKNDLEEVGSGLFRLKTNPSTRSGQVRLTQSQALDNSRSTFSKLEVYFLLSCEIASIYGQGDKNRRVHNLFFFPSLESVEKFNKKLLARGASLRSDGRPIVGIPSRNLVEIALSCDDRALIIPAHAWTPWFSVFGSFSGFDSIEECFGDMEKYIYGVETGLSSDPVMNWRIGDLDGRAILSFSDAHSLEKMGREATVFEADEVSYDSIYHAITGLSGQNAQGPVASAITGPAGRFPRPTSSLQSNFEIKPTVSSDAAGARRGSPAPVTRNLGQSNDSAIGELISRKLEMKQFSNSRIAFTIEFYPEEGKYHFTGHRDCNFSQSPEESAKNGNICPVCHRSLTIGVMHRVEQLETRSVSSSVRDLNGVKWVFPAGNGRPPYVSMVPLSEILAEVLGVQAKTQKVSDIYLQLVSNLGSEFNVLLKADLSDISRFSNSKVAEGIDRVRRREIIVEPGYDGRFGVVKIWSDIDSESQPEEAQLNLFA